MYDVIKDTVLPTVEFIQRIPIDLEEDSFLNPQKRNILILDDLMSSASKDSRINELFTEGSHHRNLSVIAINQNLFYNKDPTQRRNCQYLVLFKNPIDKQQVMTLARQMYPGNSQQLMRPFKEATEKHFGYLLIDLKPTTPESMRMRTEIFSDMPIKEQKPDTRSHLQNSSEEERTHFNSSGEDKRQTVESTTSLDPVMASCDDCGLVFDDVHDLQRHIKQWCPENDNRKRQLPLDDYEETPRKKPRIQQLDEYTMDPEDDSSNISTEEDYFKRMKKRARLENEGTRSDKLKKYRKEGLSKMEAEEKADNKLKEKDVIAFLNLYGKTILDILDLKRGRIHHKIMNSIDKFLKKGYESLPAVRMALRKYKHILEETMYLTDSDESDDEETDEEETDYDETGDNKSEAVDSEDE